MGRGKYLVNTLKKSNEKIGTTIICTFSRRIFVPFFFAAFNKMILPKAGLHLIIYDTTEDEPLKDALMQELEFCFHGFKSVRFYKSYLKGKGNIIGSGNEQFKKSKLQNIWSMWCRMKRMIKTETFFVLEDDTICPPNAFMRLMGLLQRDSRIGFVTAIETGRHAYPWLPVRLGVHKVKMRGMKVLERRSFPPDTQGVRSIDAAGVYCFAARTAAYLDGFKGYDPVSLKVPFFALDNVLTWNIKQHGWRVYADFSTWCAHLEASSARIIAFGKDQAVEQADIWIPSCNNYSSGVEVKKRGQKARRLQVRKVAQSFSLDGTDDLPEIPEELRVKNRKNWRNKIPKEAFDKPSNIGIDLMDGPHPDSPYS